MSLELRPIIADDLPDVCALLQASQRFDGVPQLVELEEMEEEFDDETVVLATDTRLALLDQQVVGYAYTVHLPSELREERCYAFGTVHPEHRRKGVGTALMEWALEHGREQLLSSGRTLPRYLRTDEFDFIESSHRLFARMGMEPVRYGEELLRPLVDLPPIPTVSGVTIVPWPEGRDEEIRQEKNTAFADHWGSTPTPPGPWQHMVRGVTARPDLSFIALDDAGNVVGHCLSSRHPSEDEMLGRRDAWIDSLGTLREWRGRGIASAFVVHSLHAFLAAGCTHASIGVDSENPTGAARLYRSLGFELQHRRITHQLEV